MAVFAVYLACLCNATSKLVKGETGVVLLIAPDIRQAKVLLGYALGTLESAPVLKQLISAARAESIELSTGIKIEVRSSSFRRIRGITCVAVLGDECAFWMSDDSANPDTEILAAARPALATTEGPLICISSPYARRGALWQVYKKHFGPDGDPAVLVCQGGSRDFNSSLPQSVVDRALEHDAAAAGAEYLAQFRTDVESFMSREAVENCIDPNIRERPHLRAQSYVAFVDPSGGSSDSMTIAIAHSEGSATKTHILDAIRERRPPFSPEGVVAEFVKLMQDYRVSTVVGDRYGGEWVGEQFRKLGIHYEPSKKPKSELYGDLLPLINSKAVALIDNDRLVSQLVSLERRTARGGKDSIDHAPGSHDDVANAAAGVLTLAFSTPGLVGFHRKIKYDTRGVV